MNSDEGTDDTLAGLIGARPRSSRSAAQSLRSEIQAAKARRELFGAAPAEDGQPTASPGMVRLGDYTLLDYLGGGAMGEVYAAYDPQLDRKIAIKVVRTDLWSGEARKTYQDRLLREARALARLSHPNVVTVHRVDADDDRIYIALEYVDGSTLTAWMRRHSERDGEFAELLEVFIQAARGLEAAHSVGLVHRDFKPDNVLVTEDLRVSVTDFGIAAVHDEPDPMPVDASPSQDDDGTEPPTDHATPLTRTGQTVGTPAYMAPEQWRGDPTDARTDVFAFCVTLHEAVYGQRPFSGHTRYELCRRVLAGERDAAPEGVTPARGLRAIIDRGLSPSPDDRYAGMQEIVTALERVRGRNRTRIVALLGGGSLLGAAAVFGAVADDAKKCDGLGEEIEAVWNPSARAELARRFEDSGKVYAADVTKRVTETFDTYVESWTAMRSDACRATHERGVQSEALLDLRMRCLDERRHEFQALVRELTKAEDGVGQAAQAAYGLSPIEDCREPRPLVAERPPDDLVDAVAEVREGLAEVRGLLLAGRYDDAGTLATELRARASALGWPPLELEAAFALAQQRRQAHQGEEAEELLDTTIWGAETHGLDRLKAMAKTEWIYVVGDLRGRSDDALTLERSARASVVRIDDPELEAMFWQRLAAPLLRSGKLDEAREAAETALLLVTAERCADAPDLEPAPETPDALVDALCDDRRVLSALNNLAVVQMHSRRYAAGRVYAQRVAEARRESFGTAHPEYAVALNNLGTILNGLGRYDEARKVLEEALEIRESALGKDRIETAGTLNNLAAVAENQGRIDDGISLLRRALSIKERVDGPDHPNVGISLHNLGNVLRRSGRTEQARQSYTRALEIFQSAFGEKHPSNATIINSLGNVLLDDGKPEQAEARYRSALSIWEALEHRDVHLGLSNLGRALFEQGRPDEAIAALERSVELRETTLGGEHPSLATPLRYLGLSLLAADRPDAAVTVLRRALALQTDATENDRAAADTRFALARALWAVRPGDTEALRLAGKARSGYGGEAEARAARTEVDAWLTARQ